MTQAEIHRRQLELAVGALANVLKASLPKEVGFVLLLSDFGVEGSFSYAANIERRDVVALLAEAREKIRGDG